jgi:D-beta-D-heptose 7-phosphate kinase/D-beta-D-heptose 1-phosphate adenosyltransferase
MTFRELLHSFQNRSVLVVGDVMLDEYIYGTATRISPEAPVMVIRHRETSAVPGGAANVALNVLALGGHAAIIGVTGADAAAQDFKNAISNSGLGGDFLVQDPSRPTTRKTRVVANSAHQVLRIDQEVTEAIDRDVEAALLERLDSAIAHQRPDAILASDYQKGCLTDFVISSAKARAHDLGIPFIANAKPSTAHRYAGAALVSLNKPESEALLGREIHREDAVRAAEEFKQVVGCHHALVTLSGDGMATEEFLVDPISVNVFDPAGAGDTAIATIALGLAAVGFQKICFDLAAQTAGAVVQRIGVAVPTSEDLERIASRGYPF